MAGFVARGEEDDVVGGVVAEILIYHFGYFARTVTRSPWSPPAVAHHQRFFYVVGVLHNLLQCFEKTGFFQILDTGQVEVGARGHAAVGSVGVFVGHGNREVRVADFVDDDAGAASRRGCMRAVVHGLVVGGQLGNAGGVGVLVAFTVIDVCPLDATVSVLVLEGNVLEVEARVDESEHHARAVVPGVDSHSTGILRQVEQVVHMGQLLCYVGHRAHQL